ncbi:MAG TPA: LLM class flavin-dependent oxidoreductase [Streptosporangiaceae bacterium]|nr:LLM class flavin-dependent oxidoreductase [Streptosporangiaceae bacterium]
MRFGVHIGQQNCTMRDLRYAWRRIEELGFDWISGWDHFYAAQIDEAIGSFEAVSCHAALAVSTERVRVGCLVYSAGYRHPAVLASAAATIDHLSEGRVEIGVGAGWHEAEYRAYGLPFESPAVRLRRAREFVTILRALLAEPSVTFEGEFWSLHEAFCTPVPLQRPSPRIWVGAYGPRALAQAGAVGDGWNATFVSPAEFARQRRIVLDHARDPGTFQTSLNLALVPEAEDLANYLTARFGAAAAQVRPGSLHGSVPALIDQVGRYADAGADWVMVAIRAPFELDALESFASGVIPAFGSTTGG